MYADDLLLISSSVIDLQRMLNICGLVGDELGIKFNGSKSNSIAIGPKKVHNLASLYINTHEIQWVNKIKYLGVTLQAGTKFSIDLSDTRRKFFISVNNILNKSKRASDMSKLQLIESHCLPILMYGIDGMNLPKSQLKDVNAWWNYVYRKIFNYNKWESVKELISLLNRLDVVHLVRLRRLMFFKRMTNVSTNNCVIDQLYNMFIASPEAYELQCQSGTDLCNSFNKIKHDVSASFHSKFV
jgi:hypothetical protein